METKLGLVCRKCSYDANPVTATHCEICCYPLKQNISFNDRISKFRVKSPILWLGLAMLLLFPISRGLLLLMDRRSPDPTTSSTTSNNLSRSRGIQLYNSMREVQNVPEGLFNYSSAPQFAALTSHGMNDAITQAHPKFRLRYAEPSNNIPGSSTVIAMLVSHLLSFGQTARPIEAIEYSQAQQHNFTLEQIPIGFDGIAFYTHRDLTIAGLSINQLQNIFMGKVRNWKQVGGPNLPIVPISLNPETNSSIKYLFASIKGAKLGSNVQIVRDYTEQTRKVASNPGAISYGSMATTSAQKSIRPFGLAKGNSNRYVQPFTPNRQINAEAIRDGSYPLTRRLFVVIRRDGLLDEQAGVAYANLLLSTEGQRIIDKAGFVSIRQ
jgi:ABC-type phosphate transport system substrate-binding protein